MLGYIISGVLLVLIVILIALYKEKLDLIKDIEKDRNNIRIAYQNSLNKEQEALVKKNDEIKKENKKLINENKNLVKIMSEKDSLFQSIKRENENLKDGNIKLNKELQIEKYKSSEQIDSEINSRDEIILDLKEQLDELKSENKVLSENNKNILELNKSLNIEISNLSLTIEEKDKKIGMYQEYVKELNSDIKEFEQAYVSIGGKLSDIYEDYEE